MTPGWVDIHTHYDGQATWDDLLAPSALHGVTTVVMGNCGVGFAPVRPARREWLIGLMEGVEDIPGTALSEGIDWQWESFPEYLDALGRRKWAMDVGAQIAHGAVRAYVMGDRGARNEPATPADIDAMREIVRDADQRRSARVLDLADDRPPSHRRGTGAGYLRGRGRAVRHRRGARRPGSRCLRARPGRRRRRGRPQPGEGGGLDASAVRQDQAARHLRARPSRCRARTYGEI